MTVGNIIGKIKRKENRFYRTLYCLAWRMKKINIPKIEFIYLPVYYVYRSTTQIWRYFMQKLLYEPMFKARCAECGAGFRILHGMPLLSENLKLYVGENVILNGVNSFAASSVLDSPVLEIGDNTIIGYEVLISVGKKIRIGKNCLISDRVFICDNYGHPTEPSRRGERVRADEIEEVYIGNNVWIGYQAFVGRGVKIGDGAVIGINSVVLNDVPANHVVLGSPANIFRRLKCR